MENLAADVLNLAGNDARDNMEMDILPVLYIQVLYPPPALRITIKSIVTMFIKCKYLNIIHNKNRH